MNLIGSHLLAIKGVRPPQAEIMLAWIFIIPALCSVMTDEQIKKGFGAIIEFAEFLSNSKAALTLDQSLKINRVLTKIFKEIHHADCYYERGNLGLSLKWEPRNIDELKNKALLLQRDTLEAPDKVPYECLLLSFNREKVAEVKRIITAVKIMGPVSVMASIKTMGIMELYLPANEITNPVNLEKLTCYVDRIAKGIESLKAHECPAMRLFLAATQLNDKEAKVKEIVEQIKEIEGNEQKQGLSSILNDLMKWAANERAANIPPVEMDFNLLDQIEECHANLIEEKCLVPSVMTPQKYKAIAESNNIPDKVVETMRVAFEQMA